MQRRARTIICCVTILMSAGTAPSLAQRTGTLVPKTLPGTTPRMWERAQAFPNEVERIYGTPLSTDEQANFALLMSNPLMTSAMRTSAWSLNLVAQGDAQEARIQANLCDVKFLPTCDSTKTAIHVGFAGPLSKSGKFTELADLNGFVGTNRMEAGASWNLTNATWRPTVSGTFSYWDPKFTYKRAPALTEASERHQMVSYRFDVGFKGSSQAIGFGVRHDDTFKNQDSTLVCSPTTLGPAGSQTCNNYLIGAPLETVKTVATVEYRVSFSKAIAASLTATHDFAKHLTGFDVPIWVVPLPNGGLGGGIRLGYRTDIDRMTVSLFYGAFKF